MKIDFIKHEVFILTIMGAFQHNKIYGENVNVANKIKFRKSLELLLNIKAEAYKKMVSESNHLMHLDELKSSLELAHKDILLDEFISFGTVQKILNLYLKYLWSIDLIVEPPHCPIDSIILNRLNDFTTRWTKMNKNVYINTIEKIKLISEKRSIAEWELLEFSRR